jgi:DNA-binding winged helix-turn-helix (wHTH) protein
LLAFPPYRLDLDSERIWKHDKEVHLRRKPFAILRYLVRNPQRLVTHAEIVEAVWGKIAMSESLLRTHMRDLRKVLGDGLVETVAGRGYRFVAELSDAYADDSRLPSEGATEGNGSKPVVAREAELDSLRGALRSVRDRRRATVLVTGEAGVGKTTLVDSFLERAGAQGSLLVGRGACIEQYGSGQVYLPVLDAMTALCRGRGGERVLEVLARHAPTWLVQMPGLVRPDRLEELQRRASGGSQARALHQLAEALEALSGETPVVLVLDDLQWTDPSTAELLALLSSRREPARLLVVGTYRPAEVSRGNPLARVSAELLAHRQATVVALEPFASDAVDAYLASRFPGHRFPPDFTLTLAQTTGGNPLFVATFLDDLETQGLVVARDGGWDLASTVEDVAARRPDGIRRLIDTQIDRLGAAEQRIVEAAAVVGMVFAAGLVAHALDEDADGVDSACESLATERGLLKYEGTETWPDGTIQSRYAFGHSLFQHAALKRSTSATIRTRHRKIAERLEAGYGARADEVAAELAVHFDLGQVPAKAAQYCLAAGDSAARRYGFHEAVAHYERVRALLGTLPEGRDRDLVEMRATHRLGWKLFQRDGSTDAALPALGRARELAMRLDDKPSLGDILVRLTSLSMVHGDMRNAGEYARAAAPLVDELGDANLRTFSNALEATAVLLRGDLKGACELFDGLGVFRDAAQPASAEAVSHLVATAYGAFALWLTGKPDDAVALARRGYEAAEALDDPWERAALLSDWATVHAWRREPEKAAELARRSLALAEQGTFGLWVYRADLVLGWAEAHMDSTISEERTNAMVGKRWEGVSMGRALPCLLYASMCARLGRTGVALDSIAKNLEAIEQGDERWLEAELHRLRAEILAPSDAREAERSLRTAIEIARRQCSTSLELRATRSLHATATGDEKRRARDEIARLLPLVSGGRDTPDVIEATRALGTGSR